MNADQEAQATDQIDGMTLLHPAFGADAPCILFGCDANYFPHVFTCIISILQNTDKHTSLDFIVFHEDIPQSMQEIAVQWLQNRANSSIRFVNINYIFQSFSKSYLKVDKRWHISTYYRIFAFSLLRNFKKIIYLDADIICNNDIKTLFYSDLHENIIGACQDASCIYKSTANYNIKEYWKDVLEMDAGQFYFNAGVLVLDIQAILQTNCVDKIITKLQSRSLEHCDQDALNWAFNGHVEALPSQWNTMDTQQFDDNADLSLQRKYKHFRSL